MRWKSFAVRKYSIQIIFFLFAILLYIPGIWWGMAHATAPDRVYAWGSDEIAPLGPVAELYSVFLSSAEVYNPQYPLFHYMVQAVFIGPFILFQWVTGGMTQPGVDYPFGFADPVTSLAIMTILGRVVNLLMGAGVVVVAFNTGRTLWDRRTGIIAGILVLLLYPMFYYSRTSNVDMGALFWLSLGIAVYANIIRQGLTIPRAIWLGVFAGLSTATKDASFAVFLPIAVVLLIVAIILPYRRGEHKPYSLKAMIFGLLASVFTYLVASGLLFDLQRYIAHVRFILGGSELGKGLFYFSNPANLQGYINFFGELSSNTIAAMGVVLLVFAFIGMFSAWKFSRDLLFIALTAAAVILFVLVPVRYVLFRFVLPIVYVLTLFAAFGFATGISSNKRYIRSITLVILVGACGYSLLRGIDLSNQMLFDSRYAISEWFEANAYPGEEVGYYGAPLKLPHLAAEIVTVPMPGQVGLDDTYNLGEDSPEFVLVIPQQHFEPVHEWTLSDQDYLALTDGSMGYDRVLWVQTPSLFSKRPIPFVNPPVQLFVRHDRLGSLPSGQ